MKLKHKQLQKLLFISILLALTSCTSTTSEEAFATSVVQTIVAQQTAAILTPSPTPSFQSTYGDFPSINEFNAPGLIGFARIISSPTSISLNPEENLIAESDYVGSSIIDLASRRDIFRYLEFQDKPIQVRWSPNGSSIAGCQENRIVQFWNPTTGESQDAIRVDSKNNFVSYIEWSPDSRYLITLSDDVYIYIWNVSKKELYSTIQSSGARILSASWSPDGGIIAAGTDNGELLFYNIQGELTSKGITENSNPITLVKWSSDGLFLAYAETATIHIHDYQARFSVQRFEKSNSTVSSIKWSPDNKLIAAGYTTGVFSIWEVKKGKELFFAQDFTGGVTDLAWTKNGQIIFTSSSDGIRYWGVSK